MRTFLCLISLIAVFNSYAQNINKNSPYIWEEIEVIDTVKAEEMANKIKSDKKADISKSNEKISTQITLLTMLKDKSPIFAEFQADVKDRGCVLQRQCDLTK